MNAMHKTLLYSAGLAASFVLGIWFSKPTAPVAAIKLVQPAAMPVLENERVVPPAVEPAVLPSANANVYALVATDPRVAMDEAMKVTDATRLGTLQNVMAVWLRQDRLAAAEWMTGKRGLREFEPLSAQVSDAFFPDDTEMSAMFSFDLTDASLRDGRVNRLVTYWKSGAHLKFDNSPWEVDGPGTGPAKPSTPPNPAAEPAMDSVTPETSPSETPAEAKPKAQG